MACDLQGTLKEIKMIVKFPRVSKFIVRLNVNGVFFDSLPVSLRVAEELEASLQRQMPAALVSIEEAM